jgi:N-acetylglutamate synthase-like GNAT family acetyltransferase
MNIRPAVENDIPAIVSLLKESLGESMMPKSEKYWNWKHVENPFGRSPVLVSEENSSITGVRAFMQWQWRAGDRIIKGVRAVDTATHPDFQGKGIFKKLTLSLVESCRDKKYDLIFNTPNDQSKPGYLKMGWEEAGKLPILVRANLVKVALNLLGRKTEGAGEKTGSAAYFLKHPGLAGLLSDHSLQTASSIVTNVSPEYLQWRYIQVPVATYVALGHENGTNLSGLIVARVKTTRLGRELRITDFFLASANDGRQLLTSLKVLQKEQAIDYTTISGTVPPHNRRALRGFMKLNAGPVVTIRNLNFDRYDELKQFKKWSPALGDLELF